MPVHCETLDGARAVDHVCGTKGLSLLTICETRRITVWKWWKDAG